jgi:DNA-binding transcriptional LysR family regulator
MTLEQLRIFAEVAAREHITRAATYLNMTQSAVSAAITTLETRHGVTLLTASAAPSSSTRPGACS